MTFGIVAFVAGLAMVVLGTWLRRSIGGAVLIIVGSSVAAVGGIFLGLEGLTR